MASLRTLSALVAAAAVATALPMAARAQDQGGGPPRGGFGRGGFGFGMQREVTLASAPLSALASGLGLSDEQKAKVETIQKALRDQMMEEMQAMRQNFQGGGGGFDPQAMREMMQQMQEKMRAADGKASAEIEKVLTDEQKAKLPGKMADWKLYQSAGFAIDAAEELGLTDEQKKKLAEWVKKNPRPQGGPGGFGGPGGRGGGRRGGGAGAGAGGTR